MLIVMEIRKDYCVYAYLDPDDKNRVYYVGQGIKMRPFQEHPATRSMKEHKSRFSLSVQKLIEKGDIIPPAGYTRIIQENMHKCEAQLLEQTLIRKHGINTKLFDQSNIGNSLLNSKDGEYTDLIYNNLRNCPNKRELYNLIYEETKSSDLNGQLNTPRFQRTSEEYDKKKKKKPNKKNNNKKPNKKKKLTKQERMRIRQEKNRKKNERKAKQAERKVALELDEAKWREAEERILLNKNKTTKKVVKKKNREKKYMSKKDADHNLDVIKIVRSQGSIED
jgi:hypothetical protein